MRTGRAVSAVRGLALSKGSSVVLTQMLRVPLNGLMKAMNLPSGEICAPEISGSPKNRSRSMSGRRPDYWASDKRNDPRSIRPEHANMNRTSRDLRKDFRKNLDAILATSFQ